MVKTYRCRVTDIPTATEQPVPGAGFAYRISADDTTGDISGTPDESTLGFGTCSERSNAAPCP